MAPDGQEILQNIEPFLAEPSTIQFFVITDWQEFKRH